MSNWDNRGEDPSGPLQAGKSRPLLTGDLRATSGDGLQNAPPTKHIRSHSFFSFGSKKGAQEQAQQALETVPQSPTSAEHRSVPDTPTQIKRPSLGDAPSMNSGPAIQREIKSVVDLALAHAHKIYYSGPLVRRIERLPDGHKPARDEGWVDVWAQLGGTTLSVWDMKAIEEANKRGEEVPPSYINITDCFVQVLGALTSPPTPTSPARRYTNVITLNTAGSNMVFFACPSSAALVAWASSIRLAAWEKSRLEEIYTGHLLRMSLSDGGPWREPATTLIKNRLEGDVKVRIAGQTDWKPLWMVLTVQSEPATNGNRAVSPISSTRSKNRMSNLFSRQNSISAGPTGPVIPVISFYPSQKSKDRKKPLLTMRYVSQAFAVYPERPEVIQKSTLIKVEGLLGQEDLGGTMKGKESWLMIMPQTQQEYPVLELIKWLIAIHDLFGLYGRPDKYIWDPLQPLSMWFGYPVGPQRTQLFVDREVAEHLDPRDDRTSAIRRELRQMLMAKMYGTAPPPGAGPQLGQEISQRQHTVPEEGNSQTSSVSPSQQPAQQTGTNKLHPTHQLPPLDFVGQAISPEQQPLSSNQTDSALHQSQQPVQYQPSPQRAQPQLSPFQQSQAPPPHQRAPQQAQSSHEHQPAIVQSAPPSASANGQSNLVTRSLTPPPTQSSPPSSRAAPVRQSPTVGGDIYSRPNGSSGLGALQSKDPSSSPSSIELYPTPRSNAQSFLGGQTLQSPTNAHTPSLGSTRSPSNDFPQESSAIKSQPSSSSGSYSRTVSPTQQQGRFPSPPPAPSITSSPLNLSFSPVKVSSPHVPGSPTKPDINRTAPTPLSTSVSSPTTTVGRQMTSDSSDLANEAGVLFLLRDSAQLSPQPQEGKQKQGTWSTDEEDSDFTGPEQNPPPRRTSPLSTKMPPSSYRSEVQSDQDRGTTAINISRQVGRKPSGARAKPGPSTHRQTEPTDNLSTPLQTVQTPFSIASHPMEERSDLPYDDTAAALAALSFLEQEEAAPAPSLPPPVKNEVFKAPTPPPQVDSLTTTNEGQQYRSSFAPSRQAAERKAKALAQQEASYAATHKPGKPKSNGGTKSKGKARGAWAESSDEEDGSEEDEDEDEDGSDGEKEKRQQLPVRQPQPVPATDPRASVYPSAQPSLQAGGFGTDTYGQRSSRSLPHPPTRGDPNDSNVRVTPAQHDDRTRIISDEPRSHTINPHVAARQSVWSTVLDPQPPSRNAPGRDTFIQVEESETMTKAFQPQGLLSAGLQDKEDRSAKRQEELARETGASLINVPNKPPPPQTGLLGAITAHERERKREGGVGATLTERERERRLAEERQRKLDDLQRQQLDQMSQGGVPGAYDAYGQQGLPGFMPGFDPRMSMNPMMLNPYMAGGFPMMPFTPQQMMAAQMAAQQAYQQAMMSFSQAGGSQMGDNSPQLAGTPQVPGVSPQSTGTPSPMHGGMMGMDPRMSMNMNPWMGGMPMGMPMGMGPMAMNSMAMMDPRMSMNQAPYLQRPDSTPAQNQGRAPFQVSPSPRGGSPAPQRSSNNSPRLPA